jgi:hypothetical protein
MCAENGDLLIGPGVEQVVMAPTNAAACDPTRVIRWVVLDFKLGVDLSAVRFDIRRA